MSSEGERTHKILNVKCGKPCGSSAVWGLRGKNQPGYFWNRSKWGGKGVIGWQVHRRWKDESKQLISTWKTILLKKKGEILLTYVALTVCLHVYLKFSLLWSPAHMSLFSKAQNWKEMGKPLYWCNSSMGFLFYGFYIRE